MPLKDLKVGDRVVDKRWFRGNVAYIGKVCTSIKNPDAEWIGVIWDDASRGKHDGSVEHNSERVRYFTCPPECTGSFVKAKHLRKGVTFKESLSVKYDAARQKDGEVAEKVGDREDSREWQDSFDGGRMDGKQFTTTLYGVNKVRRHLALDKITYVSLEEDLIATAGSDEEITKLCPNVEMLYLNQTLIANWDEIGRIASQLSRLRLLNCSDNALRSLTLSKQLYMSAFSTLEVLVLNNTGVKWDTVQRLESSNCLPSLLELRLCNNNIQIIDVSNGCTSTSKSILPPMPPGKQIKSINSPVEGFKKLVLLDLSFNSISSWDEVLRVRYLPCLEQLLLNENSIDKIYFPSEDKEKSFNKLCSLSLSRNNIGADVVGTNAWASVDEFDKFENLKALRFEENPLLDGLGPRQVRQALIARVGKAELLNGSEVRKQERREAEKMFLFSTLKQVMLRYAERGVSIESWEQLLKNDDSNAELRLALPRLDELIRSYGLPASLRSSSTGNSSVMGDSVELLLRCMAASSITSKPRTQRMPRSMTVANLAMLCSRVFKLSTLPGRIVLRYVEQHNVGMPLLLDDPERTLAYYGLMNGGEILVQDAKDNKKARK